MATTTRNLTKAKAVAAYKALVKAYADQGVVAHEPVVQDGQRWPDGPVLCRDFELWSGPTRWAIVWEGGPYDWAIEASSTQFADDRGGLPEGVFVEPIVGWALGLYPA